MQLSTTSNAITTKRVRKQPPRNPVVGYATELIVNYKGIDGKFSTERYYAEGTTLRNAFAAAKAEQQKQLAITGTINVTIGGTYPVTKPLQ